MYIYLLRTYISVHVWTFTRNHFQFVSPTITNITILVHNTIHVLCVHIMEYHFSNFTMEPFAIKQIACTRATSHRRRISASINKSMLG